MIFIQSFCALVFAENLFTVERSKEEIENPKKEKGQASLSLSLSTLIFSLKVATTSTQLRPLNTSTLHQKRRRKNFSSIFLNHLEEYMM